MDLNQSPEEIFIRNYNVNHWLITAKTYQKLIEDDPFAEEKTLSQLNKVHRIRIYKSHLHMLVFHAIETLFALTITLARHPEKFMQYRVQDLKTDAEDIARLGIGGISGEKYRDTIRLVFYNDVDQKIKEQGFEKEYEDSIEEINKFFIFSAEYLLHNEGYNSFKHSLRTFFGEGKFLIERMDGKVKFENEGDMMFFFTKDKDKIVTNFEIIDIEESTKLIIKIHELIRLIIDTRRHILKKTPEFKVHLFRKDKFLENLLKKKDMLKRTSIRLPS